MFARNASAKNLANPISIKKTIHGSDLPYCKLMLLGLLDSQLATSFQCVISSFLC